MNSLLKLAQRLVRHSATPGEIEGTQPLRLWEGTNTELQRKMIYSREQFAPFLNF